MSASLPDAVVIDACVAGAWSFNEDDTTEALKVARCVYSGQLVGIVPDLFWPEFQQVCRKKWNEDPLVSIASAETSYLLTGASPLVEIPWTLGELRDDAWHWVKTLNLGSYDAYYLALALALDLNVWTFDRKRFRDLTLADPHTAGRVKVPGEDVFL